MNEKFENLRQLLNTGATLYSVGQLDSDQRAWLNYRARQGKLHKSLDYNRYPKPCVTYYVPFGGAV